MTNTPSRPKARRRRGAAPQRAARAAKKESGRANRGIRMRLLNHAGRISVIETRLGIMMQEEE